MIDALSASTGAMLAQMQRLDAVANDVANVDTDGYKSTASAVGAEISPNPAQGPLEQTDRPLDLAIEGSGYFQVQRPNGQVAVTRAGTFQLDSQGRLVTPSGDPLVPSLQLPAGIDPSAVSVASDGTVAANGAPVGRIRLVTVPAPAGLIANGDGTLSPTAASGPVRPAGGSIQQGFVEGSNVDLADSMVGMIVAQRSFEAAASSFRTADETFTSLLGVLRR
jgi:flagellar basal-body rod protein FlgG